VHLGVPPEFLLIGFIGKYMAEVTQVQIDQQRVSERPPECILAMGVAGFAGRAAPGSRRRAHPIGTASRTVLAALRIPDAAAGSGRREKGNEGIRGVC